MKKENYSLEFLHSLFAKDIFIHAVISGSREKTISKATLRPLHIKNILHYQLTKYCKEQTFHTNFSLEECIHWLHTNIHSYKQFFFIQP